MVEVLELLLNLLDGAERTRELLLRKVKHHEHQ